LKREKDKRKGKMIMMIERDNENNDESFIEVG
jgi:hypothetical protein